VAPYRWGFNALSRNGERPLPGHLAVPCQPQSMALPPLVPEGIGGYRWTGSAVL